MKRARHHSARDKIRQGSLCFSPNTLFVLLASKGNTGRACPTRLESQLYFFQLPLTIWEHHRNFRQLLPFNLFFAVYNFLNFSISCPDPKLSRWRISP